MKDPRMQNQQTPQGSNAATGSTGNRQASDPGFILPGQGSGSDAASAGATVPAASVSAASLPAAGSGSGGAGAGTLEVAPAAAAARADTSSRDLAIGGTAFLILLVIFFFVRNAYVHHLVVRRVAPASAGNAGWLMFVGFCFLSAAAVLAIINASKFLTFAVTGPLVAVGLVALVATLLVGRR